MIKVFTQIARGSNTIEKLVLLSKKSRNFISEVLTDLEKEGFISKKKSFIDGSRISVGVSNSYHAIKFKELIFEYPTINFEDILSDSRLLFLAALSEDWTSIEIASKLSGISRHMIARYFPMLKNRGVVIFKDGLCTLNRNAWPLLSDSILSYKNYALINGFVKWKYQDETLLEVDNENLVKGSLTGLARYKDYGVEVFVVKALCRIPEGKLSKEEIFVHSLFQIDDPRTMHLAMVFYIKNNLSYKKVLPIAMKYGKYTLFNNLLKRLHNDTNSNLTFDRKDFNRVANIYGVENV